MPPCSPIPGKCIIKRSALSEESPARLRPMSGFDPSSRPWSGRPSFRTTMLAAIPEHAATPANAKRRLLLFLDMILRSTARGLSAFSQTFYMPAKLDMRNATALRSFERPSSTESVRTEIRLSCREIFARFGQKHVERRFQCELRVRDSSAAAGRSAVVSTGRPELHRVLRGLTRAGQRTSQARGRGHGRSWHMLPRPMRRHVRSWRKRTLHGRCHLMADSHDRQSDIGRIGNGWCPPVMLRARLTSTPGW
jgi:hypothetical protein